MSDELSKSEVEILKERFRATGCKVTDLEDAAFEIVGSNFPLRTHVYPNPYYLQLATYIFASPRGFLPSGKGKLYEYLSETNRNAKLVKFTLERQSPPAPKGVWPILASVKLVTGVAGGDYDADALKNLGDRFSANGEDYCASAKPSTFNQRLSARNRNPQAFERF